MTEKNRSRVEVFYHVAANPQIVNQLVAEHAAELLCGVDLNRQRGNGQAYYFADGYILSAGDRQCAERQGLTLKPAADYFIFGLPEESEVGHYIKDVLAKDPKSIGVGMERFDLALGQFVGEGQHRHGERR